MSRRLSGAGSSATAAYTRFCGLDCQLQRPGDFGRKEGKCFVSTCSFRRRVAKNPLRNVPLAGLHVSWVGLVALLCGSSPPRSWTIRRLHLQKLLQHYLQLRIRCVPLARGAHGVWSKQVACRCGGRMRAGRGNGRCRGTSEDIQPASAVDGDPFQVHLLCSSVVSLRVGRSLRRVRETARPGPALERSGKQG